MTKGTHCNTKGKDIHHTYRGILPQSSKEVSLLRRVVLLEGKDVAETLLLRRWCQSARHPPQSPQSPQVQHLSSTLQIQEAV